MIGILISDRPQWVKLILNGKKKAEVRRGSTIYKAINKLIKAFGYADIFMYCTKPKNWKEGLLELDVYDGEEKYKLEGECDSEDYDAACDFLNGYVVAHFKCYHTELFEIGLMKGALDDDRDSEDFPYSDACMSTAELLEYAYDGGRGPDTQLTTIQISELEIFYRPKELSVFKSLCCINKMLCLDNFKCSFVRFDCPHMVEKIIYDSDNSDLKSVVETNAKTGEYTRFPTVKKIEICCKNGAELSKAPQSWCYVEVEL